MRRPSARDLDEVLERAARGIAEVIRAAGGQTWIVGGAARDLALESSPTEVDLATDLVPDRIEALFEQTVGVGKAFGTMIVVWEGTAVEVTTFRSERGYSDARRPDEVTYGTSVEEDAARRDFTCNALYVDPITDEFRDPERGLDDLRAGRLACVGSAAERFREDGLRILRLARFAARLDLDPEPETLAAARAQLDALRGVSAERVRMEFEKVFAGPRPVRAFRLLGEVGALDRLLPAWCAGEERLALLERLGDAPGSDVGFAALFDPAPAHDPAVGDVEALAALDELRVSREQRRTVARFLDLFARLARAVAAEDHRAERLRLYREPRFADAVRLFAARAPESAEVLEALLREGSAIPADELRPEPLLVADDLLAAGVERGPRLGSLLRALEDAQLERRVRDEAGARRWLADQLGGNQRRSDHETG